MPQPPWDKLLKIEAAWEGRDFIGIRLTDERHSVHDVFLFFADWDRCQDQNPGDADKVFSVFANEDIHYTHLQLVENDDDQIDPN